MKERPILFSGEMVRALLADMKTQTRRVVKMHPDCHTSDDFTPTRDGMDLYCEECPEEGTLGITCPYGQPGDHLWVRETFYESGYYSQSHPEDDEWRVFNGARNKTDYFYKADGIPPRRGETNWSDTETNEENAARLIPQGIAPFFTDKGNRFWRQRPSIHMPRKLSRITLEVVGVKVERLQEITLGDICKEGLAKDVYDFKPATSGLEAWRRLWDSINCRPHTTWNANPWVWVVEFKKIQP